MIYYSHYSKLNTIVEMVFNFYVSFHEYDLGIDYFIRHVIAREQKSIISILLNLLNKSQLKNEWVKVYEDAVENNFKLEKSYHYIYQEILKTGRFPKEFV